MEVTSNIHRSDNTVASYLDEGVANMDDDASIASIDSEIYFNITERGRRYCDYPNGSYYMPNDDVELERLDLMHVLSTLVNCGQLHRAPVSQDDYIRVLDIGCGSGLWADDLGVARPRWEIIGVDVSASMPTWLPTNVEYQTADIEDEWNYARLFGYIHCRNMCGSIKDWPKLIEQCHKYLEPEGWAEFEDFDWSFHLDDGVLSEDCAVQSWSSTLLSTESATGKTFESAKRLALWMRQAGFINIAFVKKTLPIGRWHASKELERIGELNRLQLATGVEAMSLRLFCDHLGWERRRLDSLLALVKGELMDTTTHMANDLYTVWGQKHKV